MVESDDAPLQLMAVAMTIVSVRQASEDINRI